MDSVTNYKLAQLMAESGGIGIIHRGWDIELQVEEVKKVKRARHGIIKNPYTISPNNNLGEAKAMMREKRVGALLVTNSKNQLLGIITKRDIRRTDPEATNFRVKVRKRMTPFKELIRGKDTLSMAEAGKLMAEYRVEQIPIVGKNRKIVGLITSKDIIEHQKMPDATRDQEGRLRVGAAIGATGDYIERASELIKAGVDVIVIDIAHGYSVVMEQAVSSFRHKFGNFELIAGNVATFDGAKSLVEMDVDGIKVGIGPGRGCITRISTGFGVPQLQAIHECYRAAENKAPVIADGGVKQDKDLIFSYLFGARSVMLGSVFAGTLETPGEITNRWAQIPDIEKPVLVPVKVYRGMASLAAIQARSEVGEEEANVEGIELIYPLKGSARIILAKIMNNIRSAISYGGARSLGELRKNFLENPGKYVLSQSESAKTESYER
jgi:IMP dehydrogenase